MALSDSEVQLLSKTQSTIPQGTAAHILGSGLKKMRFPSQGEPLKDGTLRVAVFHGMVVLLQVLLSHRLLAVQPATRRPMITDFMSKPR